MKTQIALITLLALSAIALFSTGAQNSVEVEQELEAYNQFSQWMMKFGQTNIDVAYRFPIFQENLKFIQEENARQNDYFLTLTKYAHLTNSEFQALISGYVAAPKSEETQSSFRKTGATPTIVDWVSKGVVGPVQNQGSCGGCWAFSAAQTVSSLNAIGSGTFTFLSQQQIIDCDKTLGLNSGCNGGNPFMSMKYYTAKKGLETMATYPFVDVNYTSGQEHTCAYASSSVFYTNGGAKSITASDVSAIQAAVAVNPISIAINGGSIYFQLYGGGILTNTSCKANLDHAVNIVGYDTTNSTPYWNIKNSWGADWGESGYIRIQIVDGAGICGCQSSPSTATA